MIQKERLPIVGITMGDPVGIGPEIALRALEAPSVYAVCRPVLIGDHRILSAAKTALGSRLTIRVIGDSLDGTDHPQQVSLISLSDLSPTGIAPGEPTAETGKAMVAYVEKAIDMALDGRLSAIATGPISKYAMRLAGYSHNGHTDLLSQRTGAETAVMMMAGDRLRVTLVTIHEPMMRVPDLLTIERICKTIAITATSLIKRFGIPHPSLAVAGLNPHAGESGILGDEEKRIIVPAIEEMCRKGYRIEGPFPSDTLFHASTRDRYDAVVCMYHDQGLIPFKMLHFEDGVNTTLGLPIIRTSVDHGTAYDIAGTGKADPGSLIAAIRMAAVQAAHAATPEKTDPDS